MEKKYILLVGVLFISAVYAGVTITDTKTSSTSNFDIYPSGSAIVGVRTAVSGGVPVVSAIGSTEYKIQDTLITLDGTAKVTGKVVDDITFSNDKRIILSSDTFDMFYEGNLITLNNTNPEAKAYIGWYGFYNNTHTIVNANESGIGWIGCHYNTSGLGTAHQHCSWETLDTDTGYQNTRFAISYGLPNAQMYAEFVDIDELRLGTGVDLKLANANIENQDGTLNFYMDGQTTTSLIIDDNTVGLGMKIYSGNYDKLYIGDDLAFDDAGQDIFHSNEFDMFPKGSTTLGLRIDADGTVLKLSALGASTIQINDEIYAIGVGEDGSGKVVCVKADKNLGTCTSAVGAGGTCTCA